MKHPRTSRRGRRRGPRFTAKSADKYDLYQRSVQSPDIDVRFLGRLFERLRGRQALSFREDFCGTANLCAHWVKLGRKHTAEGFDIDPEPVRWGLAHNLEPLGEPARRVTLHLKDVRRPGRRPVDLRVAQNFSYCSFKTRSELVEYFRAARQSLVGDGLFALDVHGGSEATEEMEEVWKIEGGFTYVWEQASYSPATGEYRCYITFRFRDGTELKRIFSYDWRHWTVPELKDALRDAGFRGIETYFECADKRGEGNGIFRRSVRGHNDPSWIAYVIALR